MAETAQTARFTDGEGYEKFMGQWSRAAGRLFLEWLSVSNGLKWLDVGCGTGAFTETIQQNCSPAEIVAIDPSAAQVSYAQSRKAAEGVQFHVADARSIPFENGKFDVAVSALVLNFIPDREKAVAEMRRVVRPRGTVAAYVWDFAGGSGTAQHLNSAVKELEGPAYRPAGLNPESTSRESLKALFEATCLTGVETRPIKIPVTFRDFDDYWNSNTGFASPVSTVLKSLTANQQQRIKQLVKENLPIDDQGAILYSATVNAIRGYA